MPEESRSWAQEMARRAKCAKAEMRWQYAPTNYMCTLQINTASVCVCVSMCVWVERASARLTLWLCLLWSASRVAAQSAANDAGNGRDWGDRGKGKGNAAKPTNQRQKPFFFNWQVGAPCGGSEGLGASGGGGLCQAVKMRTAFASCGANKRKHNNNDNNNKSTFALEIDFDKVRELRFMVFEHT